VKNKGIVFTIDALIAIMFVALLGIILFIPIGENTQEVEKTLINNKISDLLTTSQLLEIENLEELKENYIKLFENKKGYVKINTKKLEINKESKNRNLITQNIKYINSSNKEIYIEIGVYY